MRIAILRWIRSAQSPLKRFRYHRSWQPIYRQRELVAQRTTLSGRRVFLRGPTVSLTLVLKNPNLQQMLN